MQQEPKQREIQSIDLAKGLLDLRLEKRMTVNELSRILGISPMNLNMIEDGIRFPEYEVLIRYAKYFHCKIIIS